MSFLHSPYCTRVYNPSLSLSSFLLHHLLDYIAHFVKNLLYTVTEEMNDGIMDCSMTHSYICAGCHRLFLFFHSGDSE